MIMTSELESALKLIGISKKITMLEDSLEADEYERRIYDLIYIDYLALIKLMSVEYKDSSFKKVLIKYMRNKLYPVKTKEILDVDHVFK